MMRPRIERLTEKKLVGKRIRMSFSDNKTFELWRSFMPRRKEILNSMGTDLYSIEVYNPLYWNIFDPTNGYTAIHQYVLTEMNTSNISRDFFFESSLLLELRRLGACVMDVPIPARYGDQGSSLSEGREFVKFPIKLTQGLIHRLYRQYFLFDFSAASLYLLIGFPLFIFGFLWGIIQWHISTITGKPATSGTALLAVLPITLGVQFITQALSSDMSSMPDQPIHKKEKINSNGSNPFLLNDYLEKNRKEYLEK